jgi:hypothetical protein
MSDDIIHHHTDDGIDRQGFLKFIAWAGTEVFCVFKGGALKSCFLSQLVHDEQVTLENTKPGVYRVTENIQ